jgi:hypothetical protein
MHAIHQCGITYCAEDAKAKKIGPISPLIVIRYVFHQKNLLSLKV